MFKVKESHYGPWTKAYCDSCKVKMFECAEIHWDDGQKLQYSPLLCEQCGRARNKDHGDKTRRVEELEKLLKING